MGLVVPFALAPLDIYPVIFFVCIIICNLLYICPIKLIKKQKNNKKTSIALFADDAKCSRVVRNSDDCTALQQDLNSVFIWSQDWGLSFNKNKCEVLRISRKRNSMLESPTVNPYTINDRQLAVVPSSKDLGVLVNNKFLLLLPKQTRHLDSYDDTSAVP